MKTKIIKYSIVSGSDIFFLKSRPWYQLLEEHYEKINGQLNQICPGTHIVAPLNFHVDLTKNNFVDCVIFNPDLINVKLYKMTEGYCHDNCDELFGRNLIKKIYTGYALSYDGKWRFHSWCIDHDDNLIETTSERIMYFGVELNCSKNTILSKL